MESASHFDTVRTLHFVHPSNPRDSGDHLHKFRLVYTFSVSDLRQFKMDANSNMHTSMEKSPYLIIPPLFIFMVSMSMMMAPMMQFLLLYVCGMLHPSLGGAELPNLDSCNALDDVQVRLGTSFPI